MVIQFLKADRVTDRQMGMAMLTGAFFQLLGAKAPKNAEYLNPELMFGKSCFNL